MRSVLMMSLTAAAAAVMPLLPAQAATTVDSTVLVGTFDGNQCTGQQGIRGGITACYASGGATGIGALSGTPTPESSPGILTQENTGSQTGFTDSLENGILTYSYTGSELATYFGIFQGGSAVGCTPGATGNCFNNTYLLFYNPTGFTSGTFDLTQLFVNSDSVSHVDLFDHGGSSVPEPATWAMMLLGFGGMGIALRRSRRRGRNNPMQIA